MNGAETARASSGGSGIVDPPEGRPPAAIDGPAEGPHGPAELATANLAALGVDTRLVGVLGPGPEAQRLKELLAARGVGSDGLIAVARPDPVNAWLCRGVTCLAPMADLVNLKKTLQEQP